MTNTAQVLQPLELLDTRIPDWNRDSLAARSCPFCRSRGNEYCIRPDHLHIRLCPTCGCYFIAPSPTEEQLATFYSSYYAHHRAIEFQQYKNDAILIKEMFALDPHSDVKVRTLNSLMRLKGKRVLDVGFGMGQGLLLMKKFGADITGIDLDPDAVDFARTTLGIQKAHNCSIDDLPDTPRYNLVTLHDVIEHPLDPLALLKKVHGLLEPDGLLSIWTPNASSVNSQAQPVAFRVDLEHMQYLAFQTCRYIAGALNMTIEYLGAHGFPKLDSIGKMSGVQNRTMAKQRLRSMFKSLPGFVQLNSLRKNLESRRSHSGSYHLMCVLKRRA